MVNPIRQGARIIPAIVSDVQKRMFRANTITYNKTKDSPYPSKEKIENLRKSIDQVGLECDKTLSEDYHKYVSDALNEFDAPVNDSTQANKPLSTKDNQKKADKESDQN